VECLEVVRLDTSGRGSLCFVSLHGADFLQAA